MTAAAPPVVSVIGLGAMGSRLAANLLADGYRVHVHNRTPAATAPLVARGATAAPSPRQSVTEADVVLVSVTDDTASREVWTDPLDGVLAGLRPGSVAVECSTVSPPWVRELAAQAAAAGVRFVEAPMIGTRPQVEARALVHLVAGEADALDGVRAVLSVSAARLHACAEVGSGATLKLVVNALLATQVATLAELLGVAERTGLDPGATLELLTSLPVASPAVARAGAAMIGRSFSPNFPVDLVVKDLGYLAELATGVGGRVPMTESALAGFTEASASGHGQQDLTAVAVSFLNP